MEAQVSLTVDFSSSAFFGLLFLIFLLTITHRFSTGFRSGEFAGQSSTPTPWSMQCKPHTANYVSDELLMESTLQTYLKRNTVHAGRSA